MPERVGTDNFEEKVIGFSGISLVEFYTDSCAPCKRMSPILAELEEEYNGSVLIAKVNAAFEQELNEKYRITATPTFLLFNDGELTERFVGARKKEDIKEIIEAYKQ